MGARWYEIYLRVFKLDISRVSAAKKNISLKSRKKIGVEIADWLKLDINICEKVSYQNTDAADTIFLSGGNPYNTL
jgi:hypothetical protein